MTTVFVVQRDCGDYYCGCGGGHVTGVFTTADQAAAVVDPKLMDKVTELPLDEFRWQKSCEVNDYTSAWT